VAGLSRPAIGRPRDARGRHLALAAAVVACLGTAPLAGRLAAGQRTLSGQDDRRREVAVRITDAGFEPARIDARLNDIVAITLTADGTPHGLSVDEYRVAKRVEPGKPVRFEFRADTVGTFRFYCSLTAPDGRPHDEHGDLVVRR
jgi:heme/copper-type cytochrome/quinol oxidase subunit 2